MDSEISLSDPLDELESSDEWELEQGENTSETDDGKYYSPSHLSVTHLLSYFVATFLASTYIRLCLRSFWSIIL